MSRVKKLFGPQPASASADTTNTQGYPAFSRPFAEQYLQMLLTNTLGNTFYVSEKELLKASQDMHVLANDKAMGTLGAGDIADMLIYARNNGYMRTQPILGLAHFSKTPDGSQFERAFNAIIRTPKDLADFTTIVASLRKGSQGGRRIKRVAAKWLQTRLTEYWAIKYGAEKDGGYSLKDLIKIYHPKWPGGNYVAAYLLDKFVDTFDIYKKSEGRSLQQLYAYEKLKKAANATEKMALINLGRLPHEVASTFAGKDAEVWKAIAPQMPIFALLRNLATLERQGVIEERAIKDLILSKFNYPAAVQAAKILPFRWLEAVKHVTKGWAQDACRAALEHSFGALPDIKGSTAVMLDVSGSMAGDFLQKASIFAIALFKKAGGNGRFITFNTQPRDVPVSMHDSILTQAGRIHASGGTNTGAPIALLLGERASVDNIIIITDEQQNAGSPFVDLLAKYRERVNPNVKAFIVDIAPYKGGMVGNDPLTHFIYGWSDQVLNYISFASQGYGDILSHIKEVVGVQNALRNTEEA